MKEEAYQSANMDGWVGISIRHGWAIWAIFMTLWYGRLWIRRQDDIWHRWWRYCQRSHLESGIERKTSFSDSGRRVRREDSMATFSVRAPRTARAEVAVPATAAYRCAVGSPLRTRKRMTATKYLDRRGSQRWLPPAVSSSSDAYGSV